MKAKYILIAITATLMAAVSGCTPSDPPITPPVTPPDPLQVKVAATIGGYSDTRAEFQADGVTLNWGNSDAIGVYWERDKEMVSVPSKYTIVPSSIDNESGHASFAGDMDWDNMEHQQSIYAYYPFIGHGSASEDNRFVPVNLPGVQNQNGKNFSHLDAMVQMVGKPLYPVAPDFNKPDENNTLQMEFYPVFSVLELWLIAYDVPAQLKSIKIESAKEGVVKPFTVTNGELDVSIPGFTSRFGEITGGDANNNVVLNITGASLASTMDPSHAMDTSQPVPANIFPAKLMVLPDNYGDSGLKFTFTLSDNTQVSHSLDGMDLKRGDKYILPLVVPVTDFGYDTPGTPWDGTTATRPTLFEDKNIYLRSAEELAWIAGVANGTIDITGDENIDNARFAGYTIKLVRNINLGTQEWTPIGIANNKHFEGNFHGNGYEIEGLNISSYAIASANNSVGLFGYVKGPATITSAKVNGSIELTATTAMHVGGIIGSASGTAAAPVTVYNSSFSGTIKSTATGGSYIGGIIGNSVGYAVADRCTSNAAITVANTATSNTSYSGAGGIIGGNTNLTAKNSFNAGSVQGTQGAVRAGGIVGHLGSGSVYGSKNAGNISVNGNGSSAAGIVAFFTGAEILSCYNTGNITGTNINAGSNYSVGGIVGTSTYFANGRTIRGCYTTGTVNSNSPDCVGNFGGRFPDFSFIITRPHDFSKYENIYSSKDPLIADGHPDLVGVLFKFSSENWPTSSQAGWGTGRGTGPDTYWKSPLPVSGSVYPQLWWE